MLISIIIILCAFNWLLYESDFLRVRLPVGKDEINYSGDCRLKIYHSLKNKPSLKMDYDTLDTDNYSSDNPEYYLILSPNVEPMCKDWLAQNFNKLVKFKPRIELDYGVYKQQLTFNGGEYSDIMRQVLKLHDKKFIKQLNLMEV